MSDLEENLAALRQELAGWPGTLVAVTKTKPIEVLQEAYALGLRVFGENKVQEIIAKASALPPNVEWHLIGHLQTNKVKAAVRVVRYIQSVDSFKLLLEIDKQAAKVGRVIDCLLQVHIAQEETKFGLSAEELAELLRHPELPSLAHVRVRGLMGMASNTSDQAQVRAEFRGLRQLFEQARQAPHPANVQFEELSMGMSGDYTLALAEGSTMIRVGSKLFGGR
jgi:pyridoxal phosphate enzyme (YggS family)